MAIFLGPRALASIAAILLSPGTLLAKDAAADIVDAYAAVCGDPAFTSDKVAEIASAMSWAPAPKELLSTAIEPKFAEMGRGWIVTTPADYELTPFILAALRQVPEPGVVMEWCGAFFRYGNAEEVLAEFDTITGIERAETEDFMRTRKVYFALPGLPAEIHDEAYMTVQYEPHLPDQGMMIHTSFVRWSDTN